MIKMRDLLSELRRERAALADKLAILTSGIKTLEQFSVETPTAPAATNGKRKAFKRHYKWKRREYVGRYSAQTVEALKLLSAHGSDQGLTVEEITDQISAAEGVPRRVHRSRIGATLSLLRSGKYVRIFQHESHGPYLWQVTPEGRALLLTILSQASVKMKE